MAQQKANKRKLCTKCYDYKYNWQKNWTRKGDRIELNEKNEKDKEKWKELYWSKKEITMGEKKTDYTFQWLTLSSPNFVYIIEQLTSSFPAQTQLTRISKRL